MVGNTFYEKNFLLKAVCELVVFHAYCKIQVKSNNVYPWLKQMKNVRANLSRKFTVDRNVIQKLNKVSDSMEGPGNQKRPRES